MKVLVILGHPDPESYNAALAEVYAEEGAAAGAEVRTIALRTLDFNPNLRFGYRKRTDLEPDLVQAQAALRWADHLVWVYPVWWGSVPALLKGFLDRVLLPGFAFRKHERGYGWDQLFKGKTARIICTMDQPPLYYRLRYGRPSTRAMREVTLRFIGVRRIRTTAIGPIRNASPNFLARHLRAVARTARQDVR